MIETAVPVGVAESPRHLVKSKSLPWEQLTERMSHPTIGGKEGSGWVAADILDGPRRNDRVKSVSLIVFDVDNKGIQKSVDEVAALIEELGCRAAVHSTYSHRPDLPRFRVILDVSEPIPPGDFKRIALQVADDLRVALEYAI